VHWSTVLKYGRPVHYGSAKPRSDYPFIEQTKMAGDANLF